jgi:alkylation response protein AidB-like acyl-CoA dehydrogenase
MVEEISTVCTAMGCLVSMPSGLVGASIDKFGTEAQKQQWLAPLAQGRCFGAADVTEPRSGSDVAGMTTRYAKDGDKFVIDGAKAWISNLDIADFFVTFATRDKSLRQQGVTAFIVPRDTPGVSVAPYRNKLGFRPLTSGDLVLEALRSR